MPPSRRSLSRRPKAKGSRAPVTPTGIVLWKPGDREPSPPPAAPVTLARYPKRGASPILGAEVTRPQDASKQQRQRFGRSLDLSRIESALLAAYNAGSMRDLTDLSRETIGTDPHLAGILPKRLTALARLPWEVAPAEGPDVNEGKAAYYAEVVRGQLNAFNDFAGFRGRMAWALWDGRALEEKVWVEGNGRAKAGYGRVSMALSHSVWVHPRRLNVGRERQLIIADDSYGSGGAFAPRGLDSRTIPFKFVSWTPQLFGDYLEREGLAPPSMYWSFMKRFSARERMILTELYGKPWKIIEVAENSEAQDEDLLASEKAADQLGASFTARMARGTKLVVVRPDHGDAKIHGDTIIDVDKQNSKLILGQIGTTDGAPAGLNSSQGEAMGGEQFDLLVNDAAMFSDMFEDSVTDEIIALNFGWEEVVHAPSFRLVAKRPKDFTKEGSRLTIALNAGLAIKVDEAYEATGFSQPAETDTVVRMESAPAAPGALAPPAPRAVIIYREGTAPAPGTVERPPFPGPAVASPPPERPPSAAPLEGMLSAALELASTRARAIATRHDEMCVHCVGDHRQPDGPNGNVETVLERGYGEARRAVAAIVERYESAVRGEVSAMGIVNALYKARNEMDTRPLGRVLERRMVHAAMLGALDAADEGEDVSASVTAAVKPADFGSLPFESAFKIFKKKQPIQRSEFDKLSGLAKQRAFTVAGVMNDDALIVIQDELATVIGEGGSLSKFSERITERMKSAGFMQSLTELADGSKALRATHIENVFRTNVLSAYGAARAEQMRQPAVLAKRPVWELRGVNDDRARETHRAAQGKMLLASDPFWLTAYPPYGHQCFLPGTLVEGAFLGASKARYAGKVVELTTAVGGRLSVTANHPILTPNGIVPAQSLRKGDKVLGYRRQAGIESLRLAAQRHEHDAPASVEQVFGALAQGGGSNLAGYAPDDFHGEARRFHGDVEVVGSYRQLVAYGQAAGAEHLDQFRLEATDALALRGRQEGQLRVATLRSENGVMRSGDLSAALLGRHLGPLQPLSFGLAAQLDTVLPEGSVDDLAAYAAFAGELQDGSAGDVVAHELVDVRHDDRLVHVYDLETTTGWMVAGGILASNCRCRVVSRGPEFIPKTVPGSTIVGLPDPGFTSGLGSLLSPNAL